MEGEALERASAKTLAAIYGEFTEAYGTYLRRLAEVLDKYPEGSQAIREYENDPLAFEEKMISQLEESTAVLWIRALLKFQRAKQRFYEMSSQERLKLADDLETTGHQLMRAVLGEKAW